MITVKLAEEVARLKSQGLWRDGQAFVVTETGRLEPYPCQRRSHDMDAMRDDEAGAPERIWVEDERRIGGTVHVHHADPCFDYPYIATYIRLDAHEAAIREAVEAERAKARDLCAAASEVINQWGDPFEPEEQWEQHVTDAMRQLSEASDAIRKGDDP